MKKIILLFIGILLWSCNNELYEEELANTDSAEEIETFNENFGGLISADFVGIVTNEEGEPLSGVQITIGNYSIGTNDLGYFIAKSVQVQEKFANVRAFKYGYIDGSRSLVPTKIGSNNIQITMLKKNNVGTVSSGSESTLQLGASSVKFSGYFIDSNDDPYAGDVEVSMHYLKPNTRETFERMPGMLVASTVDQELRSLETYGMLSVNLYSPSGEPLNIDPDTPATLQFPVDANQNGIAPDLMNLWYFDEIAGYWKEDGSAIKVGGKYVADVSHFTWWNCDLPLPTINACFSIQTPDGSLSNNYIEIIRNETNQIVYAGNTNEEGAECGLIPEGEELTIIVYGNTECNDIVLHTEVVGGFLVDTDITIQISDEQIQQTTLTAVIEKCIGIPVTEGVARIFYIIGNHEYTEAIIPITDGTLNYSLDYCDGSIYKLSIYDSQTDQFSPVINLLLAEGATNLGTLQTCINTGNGSGGTYNGDITLENQQEVDTFGQLGIVKIVGDLNIGIDEVPNDINSLLPLSELQEVVESIIIQESPDLIDLQGLENLEIVDVMFISDCESINTLAALESLTTIYGVLLFHNLNALPNLDGLENITGCASVELWDNDLLENIEGIQNIANTLMKSIVISNNPLLESIAALSNVMDAQNNVYIANNELLSSLQGLENLVSTGELEIFDNPALTSLEGLNALTTLTEYSHISNNENLLSLDGLQNLVSVTNLHIADENFGGNTVLSDLCALENLVNNGTFNTLVIQDNAYNPTVVDIQNGDCSQ